LDDGGEHTLRIVGAQGPVIVIMTHNRKTEAKSKSLPRAGGFCMVCAQSHVIVMMTQAGVHV
jgi:hypothetical protein